MTPRKTNRYNGYPTVPFHMIRRTRNTLYLRPDKKGVGFEAIEPPRCQSIGGHPHIVLRAKIKSAIRWLAKRRERELAQTKPVEHPDFASIVAGTEAND